VFGQNVTEHNPAPSPSVDDLVGSNREFAYRYAGLSGVLLTYECEEYLSISTNFAEKAALVSALFLTFCDFVIYYTPRAEGLRQSPAGQIGAARYDRFASIPSL